MNTPHIPSLFPELCFIPLSWNTFSSVALVLASCQSYGSSGAPSQPPRHVAPWSLRADAQPPRGERGDAHRPNGLRHAERHPHGRATGREQCIGAWGDGETGWGGAGEHGQDRSPDPF